MERRVAGQDVFGQGVKASSVTCGKNQCLNNYLLPNLDFRYVILLTGVGSILFNIER